MQATRGPAAALHQTHPDEAKLVMDTTRQPLDEQAATAFIQDYLIGRLGPSPAAATAPE